MHHSHHHDHNHAHAHHGVNGADRQLVRALALTLGFAGIEALTGWFANSLALLGDAGHMLTDASALGLAALAAVIARRPATRRHSFGMGRAEVIAALMNALFMLVIVSAIVVGAIRRLQDPSPVGGLAVMLVAALGLAINGAVLFTLSRGEQSLNMRGAILHVLGDLLGSVAALMAGIVVVFTGWSPIDPLLSLFICGLILIASLRLLREALNIIMEGVPGHLDMEVIGYTLARIEAVRSVHDLHVWTLSSGHYALSAHIEIDHMDQWEGVLQRCREILHDEFDIDHVTLQPEPQLHVLRPMPFPDERREDPRTAADH